MKKKTDDLGEVCPSCGKSELRCQKSRIVNSWSGGPGAKLVQRFGCACGHTVDKDEFGRPVHQHETSGLNDHAARMEKSFLTIDETARRLQCSRDFTLQLLMSGKLAGVLDDDQVFVTSASIRHFLEGLCTTE